MTLHSDFGRADRAILTATFRRLFYMESIIFTQLEMPRKGYKTRVGHMILMRKFKGIILRHRTICDQ